jgi:hypothetical protein
MKKFKYIVCDEDGPIRVFYDKESAQKFLQPGWTIKTEQLGKTLIPLKSFEEAPF